MKKIIIIIISLLFFNAGFSKELKIKVVSMGEPLGYSYISINGDVKTITDSIGFATLSMSWLNIGDTISASFVGYNAEVNVFDASIKEKGELTLDLTSNFIIDEVVVKIDIESLYKKFTRVGEFYHWGVTYNTKFNYTLKKEGKLVEKDSGNLYFTYPYKTEEGNWRNVIRAYAYPNSNVEKDSSFISELMVSVHFPIAHDSRFYNYILRGKAYNKRTLGYRGIIDNCRVFTATTKTDAKTTQIICYFDKETKHLTRYELSVVEFDDKGEVVMERNSELDLERIFLKKTSVFKTHIITKLKDKIKYKDLELDSNFEIDVKNWKFDKRIKWKKVLDVKTLLEPYSTISES